MGLCSVWCGGKTFHSLPCKTKTRKADERTRKPEEEEKAFAVANMWSQDSSQVKVVG